MKIISSVFENKGFIPSKYTCDGQNINPPFLISDVPKKTQSLVLIMDDPDAPIGIWVHWVLFNIDPKITKITENSVPLGAIQAKTNRENNYGGPCPPSGTHRYFFKLYALDIKLNLTAEAGKSQIEFAMKNHILDQTEIIGLYRRPPKL